MAYCEDYPCCGHTDGLGCDWTYTPAARAYDEEHAFCDHEAGFCDAYEDDDEECPEGHACEDCDNADDGSWMCHWCDRPCAVGAHEYGPSEY